MAAACLLVLAALGLALAFLAARRNKKGSTAA